MKRIILFIFILLQIPLYAKVDSLCNVSSILRQFAQKTGELERPQIQDELTLGTTHFLIHYTLEPGDPNQTTQQWVDYTAQHAEECWGIYVNLGWLIPPPDNNNGGDNRYDIYIIELPLYNGVTKPEDVYPNPYPNGHSSWIEIRKHKDPNEPFTEEDW